MRFGRILAAAMLSGVAACGGGGGSGGTARPAEVDISATGPTDPVPSGGRAQFDLTVVNPMTAMASNVAVHLSLPAGLTVASVACTASSGAQCPTDPSTLAVTGLVPSGSLHYVVQVAVAAGTRGSLTGSASATIDGAAATAAEQKALALQVFSADVQVTGQAPAGAQTSGGVTTYTMTVTNAGPDAASNVTLQEAVDNHQALGTVTCSAQGGAACPATPGAAMSVKTLPVGGTLVFSVPATIAANTLGDVTVTMSASPAGDPATGNNDATVTATTTLDPHGTASFMKFQSDIGDFVGGGGTYAYTSMNAVMQVSASGGTLNLGAQGDEDWDGHITLPTTLTQLQPGTYTFVQHFGSSPNGDMGWSGMSHGCNTTAGTLTIDSVTYDGSTLTAIDLHFDQHCEGAAPALHGQIHWLASDTSKAPGPVTPPPASLWRAPAGATPATGNYAYLESDAGDYIGSGKTYTYTQGNALFYVLTPTSSQLKVNVEGDATWFTTFRAMNTLAQLVPGYYPGVHRAPFSNLATGGLEVTAQSRGCNVLTGWFAIDDIAYTNGAITSVDVRFEQHCENGSAALRGQIHWAPGDTTAPPGPQMPVPAGLWSPPSGATPASGNYVYLQSDAGDFIGGGATEVDTLGTGPISVSTSGATAMVSANGWGGWFEGMDSIAQLQPGYYPNLEGSNPTTGGIAWSGQGRGCNTTTGWFAIDSITYSAGAVASLDMRFEQHCEGGVPALHGKVHWVASDTTVGTLPGIAGSH